MSANIYWLPVKPGIYVKTSTPSQFIDLMEKSFGHFPCDLGESDLERLKGMAVIEPEMFNELVKAIEKYKTIRVWAE